MNSEHNPGAGPLIGSIIIVILLLVGGYYSLPEDLKNFPEATVDIPVNQPVPVINMPVVPPQESTEIKDIEADVNEVDIGMLDSGLDNLDLLVSQ